jgi:hypothetical protein
MARKISDVALPHDDVKRKNKFLVSLIRIIIPLKFDDNLNKLGLEWICQLIECKKRFNIFFCIGSY